MVVLKGYVHRIHQGLPWVVRLHLWPARYGGTNCAHRKAEIGAAIK